MLRFVTLFSILIVTTAARADGKAPEDVMRAFYAWALTHPSSALPTSEERGQLAEILAPITLRLLEAASRTEAKCIEAAPQGDKPYIIEGDLFVGNYEGATEVAYGELLHRADSVVVESQLIHIDTGFPKAHKHRAFVWTAELELRAIGERWYVQDVRFADQHSLVAGLKEYIEQGSQSCGGR